MRKFKFGTTVPGYGGDISCPADYAAPLEDRPVAARQIHCIPHPKGAADLGNPWKPGRGLPDFASH